MGSVIEKITLYDILGYMLPGGLLEIIIGSEYLMEQYIQEKTKRVSRIIDYDGSYKMVIAVAYCAGIVISEIFERIIRQIFGEYTIRKSDSGISEETLKKALKNSGMVTDGELRNAQKLSVYNLQKEYGMLMFGEIQNEKQYQRIHNYASGKTMYLNLFGAMAIGGIYIIIHLIILKTLGLKELVYGVIYAGAMIAFLCRYFTFKRKQEEYTRIWFVEKYTNSTDEN